MREVLASAPHVALQFSGGRDSLALLAHMRPWWHCLTVYWLDTGDGFPETAELARQVAEAVPSFVRIDGAAPAVRTAHGWPSDVLPPGAEWPWPEDLGPDHMVLQDRYSCCFRTIMFPLHQRMLADGIEVVLRGQRDEDLPRSQIRHGQVEDGIQYLLPLASWSVEDVHQAIASLPFPLPRFYTEGLSGAPDCLHCTAWLDRGAVPYVRRHYPEAGQLVDQRLKLIRKQVEKAMGPLRNLTGDDDGGS